MKYQGVLTKMQTELASPIQYFLAFESDFIHMNQLLNKRIQISFVKYQCLACGSSKKIFRQGYCYEHFYSQPQVGDWVIRPELSKAHLDIEDRDLAFEKKAQLQPHIVYLANSGTIKIGVTRKSQIPTRWIDQGAHEAIELVEVPNRYLAGITEVALKQHISDKTNWRKMLTNQQSDQELITSKEALLPFIPDEVKENILIDRQKTILEFPMITYPNRVKSLTLQKTPEFKGTLKGIKGQYLIFDDGIVFNVRNHEGYVIELTIL